MNRILGGTAFAIGLAVVGWVGAGYLGASPLAVAVIAAIGVVYLAGAFELWRFDRATHALHRALQAVPEDRSQLDAWLERLPSTLRNAVRLRINGERVGLPGPVLAPYLVGLLVLLGMLGTFLGMVLTLHGAVAALETSADLHAIRAALAAPVKGLGFAFGTSVAGVAASAMLGLVLALCRRARLGAAQLLDTRIAGSMRALSFVHRRDRVFDALASQAAALPELVARLEAMSAQIELQGRETGERLLAGQQRFHDDARRDHSELAASVDASLKSSLAETARLAGEAIRPAVTETMAAIAEQTGELQSRLATIVERQLDGLSERFDTSVAAVAQSWAAALASHERSSEKLGLQLQQGLSGWADGFERRSTALLDGVAERSAALLAAIGESASALQAQSASADRARQAEFAQALESMAASLSSEWAQLTARGLADQQQAFRSLGDSVREIAQTTQTQAAGTVAEVARLLESAAAAPRAAAEVIEALRNELSASIARDNALLAERSRILEALGSLAASATQAAVEQRAAVEGLVNASATMLERAGERFVDSVERQSVRFAEIVDEQATRIAGQVDERSARFADSIDAHSARIAEAAGQVTVGAAEVAALGESFGHAVRLFGESSDRLMTTLERIEGALEKSSARSDEQLGYYVAQARELIDLSVASQRQVVEDLARIARNEAPSATEVSFADEA